MKWSRPIEIFLEIEVALWLLGLFAQRQTSRTRINGKRIARVVKESRSLAHGLAP